MEPPRAVDPGQYGTMPPQRYGSGEERRKYQTVSNNPVHRDRIMRGLQERLGR